MLPKLLLSSFPLSLVGLLIDPRIRSLLFPAITFVGLLSALGHKEWRFVIYVVPFFNVAAAKAAATKAKVSKPKAAKPAKPASKTKPASKKVCFS